MLKIRTGDQVIVISGQYKGIKGNIISTFSRNKKAIVKVVNSKNLDEIEIKFTIYLCKIALIDPLNGKPTRIGFKSENGLKQRISKRSGKYIYII